jgi:RNA polymerase sigma-70 factor (ECF subfamily)
MNWNAAEGPPDTELLGRFRADPEGESGRRAAGLLLARYRGRVYVWALRLMREHDAALDIAQIVMMKAWRSLPGFGERSGVASWLFAMTRNECLTALRPRALRRDPDADPAGFLIDDADPGRVLESAEEEAAIEALLRESLNPVEQQAIWLRCFERLPVDEITRILGLTHASGARSVLQSAREKLRRALAERGRKG